MSVGREASKLPSLRDKINIELEAAKVLAPTQRYDALQLLDMAWAALKEVIEGEKSSTEDRYVAASLRGDVLALYNQLDAALAKRLIKSLPAIVENETAGASQNSLAATLDSRQRADYIVKMAMAQLIQDQSKAVELAISSLSTDRISAYLCSMLRAIKANRTLLDSFEHKIAAQLAAKTSLDAFDYATVIFLFAEDKEMPATARSGLISFLLNSFERLAQSTSAARASGQPPTVSAFSIAYAYSLYTGDVRSLVSLYAPEKVESLDAALKEIVEFVPASSLESQYEQWSNDTAERQMERALKTADSKLRDTRLMNFVLRALGNRIPNTKESYLKLAATAASQISDAGLKTNLQDYVRMAEIAKLVKDGDLAVALEKAATLSTPEFRAWMLVGTATAQPKDKRNEALRLFAEAMQALDNSPASPRKVELAFRIAQFIGRWDKAQAFGYIDSAIKYANQINKESPSASQPLTTVKDI